ncbi:MAG: (deoxy)nucleoside triphosphate pyrophosphohydrolase [Saprospiraceae bacterium]|nr:(deoxy)nucleoside triphosphate pyrophosphohydrolase [Saprospiraceae bacterium]
MIKVVCGVIFDNTKILVCRRKPEKHLGGYWEFPGGKVELNELAEKALRRELLEELSMEIDKIEFFTTVQHRYDEITIELIAYTCEMVRFDFKLTDHDIIQWVTIEELLGLNLAPADIPIMKKLLKLNYKT